MKYFCLVPLEYPVMEQFALCITKKSMPRVVCLLVVRAGQSERFTVVDWPERPLTG